MQSKSYDNKYFKAYEWNSFYLLNTAILKQFLGIPNGAKLLDVGCGVGYHVKGWRRNGIEAYGVDKHCPTNMQLNYCRRGDILDLKDYKDKDFDVVTCMDVLEHLEYEELDKAISELRRVAKHWVIIQTLFKDEDHHKKLFEEDPTHKIWETKQWWCDKLDTHRYGYVICPYEIMINQENRVKFPHPSQLIITTASGGI